MDVTNLSRNAAHANMGVGGANATVSQSKVPATKSPEPTVPSDGEATPRLSAVVSIDSRTKETILKVQEGGEEFQVPSKMTLEYKRNEAPKESS